MINIDNQQTTDLGRQVQCLLDYASAQGYQVARTVKEIGSGLNDQRPKFLAILTGPSITKVVVEHQDRATRFGFRYLEALLELQGRCFEVVNLAETNRGGLARRLNKRHLLDVCHIVWPAAGSRSKQKPFSNRWRNHETGRTACDQAFSCQVW